MILDYRSRPQAPATTSSSATSVQDGERGAWIGLFVYLGIFLMLGFTLLWFFAVVRAQS